MAAALPLLGCDQEEAPPAPEVRPVRFVRAERRVLEDAVSLTGEIHAREEVSLAFRTGGRVAERRVDVGDQVVPGQLVARLDSVVQANAVASAEASLDAARAQLTQLSAAFERQRSLLAGGFTTRAQFDQAQQQLQTVRSQADAAEAGLRTAREQLGYTDLKADAAARSPPRAPSRARSSPRGRRSSRSPAGTGGTPSSKFPPPSSGPGRATPSWPWPSPTIRPSPPRAARARSPRRPIP